MASPLARARYAVSQSARVAWYMGHYFATRPYHKTEGDETSHRFTPSRETPDSERILSDMAELFRRDLMNAEHGLYPLPRDHDGGPLGLIRRSRKFLADVPVAAERRAKKSGREVFTEETKGTLPGYFLQNFHYQTGGYLTEDSAELYDTQVEVLFTGSANAMRRQALVPLYDFVRGRDQRKLRLLDVACGTGRFLRFVKDAYPRLPVTGLDLSAAYIAETERHLRRSSAVSALTANAEAIPLKDGSQDVVTCIYLYHELPPKVRRTVAGEIARVLKPGGRLIFIDSLQFGDAEGYDGLLELFPVRFHEPFFSTYVEEDLGEIFGTHGLQRISSTNAFLSKVVAFDKPGDLTVSTRSTPRAPVPVLRSRSRAPRRPPHR